jgi:hypothetical protein
MRATNDGDATPAEQPRPALRREVMRARVWDPDRRASCSPTLHRARMAVAMIVAAAVATAGVAVRALELDQTRHDRAATTRLESRLAAASDAAADR